MKDDLLAPPKMTVRKFAWIVGVSSLLAVVTGVFFAYFGILGFGDLGRRTLMVAVFAGGAVWGYSRLLRLATRLKPERMPMLHAVVGMTGILAFYGTFGLMVRGTSFSGTMPSMFWMIPFTLGTALIAGGITRRVGETLHCPKCEYEFGFDSPEDAPANCPECGTTWIGRLKKGRAVKSPRFIAAGVVIAVTGMIVGNPIFYMAKLAPHLPTSVLYAALYMAPTNQYTVWDELATRQLSPSSIKRMGERVLESRLRNQYDSSPSKWFEAMLAAKKVPKELEDRFYREGFRVKLKAPRRVKAGEAFPVELRVSLVAPAFGTQMGLMFAGYDTGDAAAAVGRRDKTVWSFELRPGVMQGRRDVLKEMLKVDHPGEVRVRAIYWMVYQPSFMDELKWQDDGTPAPPASAFWFERVELVETVTVE